MDNWGVSSDEETPDPKATLSDDNLPVYVPTPEYQRMQEFDGEWVNSNNGSHLYGGIPNNCYWKFCWRDLKLMVFHFYDATGSKIGWLLFRTISLEVTGVHSHCWDYKQFIVFQMVILQCARNVTDTQTIQHRIQ